MGQTLLKLFDFDPLRVRKELSDRRNADPNRQIIVDPQSRTTFGAVQDYEGEDTLGVGLIRAESILKDRLPFIGEIRTGRDLPFLYVEKPSEFETVCIDGERIVAIGVSCSLPASTCRLLSPSVWCCRVCGKDADGRTRRILGGRPRWR